jgi:large subunit ribosomal protein L18
MAPESRREGRARRHERVREKIRGSASRPRLAVFRSLAHIYAQLIDDDAGATLVAASSVNAKEIKASKSERAKAVGTTLGERAKAKGIGEAVFDRGGYRYHGRVKALADAVRAAGLKF